MFSDAFSEGKSRNINEGFPTDSTTTEVYDYLSDSDLEDEYSCSEEVGAEPAEGGSPELPPNPRAQDPDPRVPSTAPSEHPLQPTPDTGGADDADRLAPRSLGPSKLNG